jgi:hypothetical protein
MSGPIWGENGENPLCRTSRSKAIKPDQQIAPSTFQQSKFEIGCIALWSARTQIFRIPQQVVRREPVATH